MPRRVKGPDGTIHQFPDEATDAMISAALGAVPEVNKSEAPKAQTWSEQLGLHKPTDHPLAKLGRAVVDMAEGAKANAVGTVFEGGDLIRRAMGMERVIDRPEVQAEMDAPDTVGGMVGEYAAPVAGVAGLVKAGVTALPSAARAAKNFQSVMGAARSVPLNLSETGDAALRILQLSDRGASMPMAVRKLLNRMTDPNKAGMVYEEGRDFASNISRLSVDEMKRLTPVIKREVANLSAALNKANATAAKAAGKGDEYNAAMREYARAMKMRSTMDAMIQGAKKGAPWATAAGAGAWLSNKVAGR